MDGSCSNIPALCLQKLQLIFHLLFLFPTPGIHWEQISTNLSSRSELLEGAAGAQVHCCCPRLLQGRNRNSSRISCLSARLSHHSAAPLCSQPCLQLLWKETDGAVQLWGGCLSRIGLCLSWERNSSVRAALGTAPHIYTAQVGFVPKLGKYFIVPF